MECPACPGSVMVDHIREGVEVRRCPDCRGVWLGPRDLEHLLDLADVQSPGPHIGARVHQDLGSSPHLEPVAASGRHRKRNGAFAHFLEDVFEVFD